MHGIRVLRSASFGVGEIDFFLRDKFLFAFFSRVLKTLSLNGNDIGDEGAKALASALPEWVPTGPKKGRTGQI